MSMNRSTSVANAIALALLLGLLASPAQAQLARTFVSNAAGNDANDCSRLAPCRTFQRAHDNTFPLGEIKTALVLFRTKGDGVFKVAIKP